MVRLSSILGLAKIFALHSVTVANGHSLFTNTTTPPFNLAPATSFESLQQSYYPPNADCVDYMIPVDIVSSNYEFNFTKWDSDYDLEDFLSIATTRAGANYPSVLSGPKVENATYRIAASVCSPKTKTGKAKTVLLATHGIGPARSHWNSPFRPDEYNFVQWAVKEGYSVFFYDRLGCGASEKYVFTHFAFRQY